MTDLPERFKGREEKQKLKELEAYITEAVEAIKTTLPLTEKAKAALKEISESKLYRLEFETLDAYCKARWGFGKSQAYRWISSQAILLPDSSADVPEGTTEDKDGSKLPDREPGDDSDKIEEERKAALKEAKYPEGSPAATPGLPKDVANALADTWHLECARILSKMAKECKAAFSWSSWLDGSVLDILKSAEQCFLAAAPRSVCPDCQGKKKIGKTPCQTCRHGGYLGAQG